MPVLPSCPSQLQLQAFALGRLDDASSAELELHTASCSDCQRLLTTLAADDTFVQAMRIQNAAGSGTPDPNAPDDLVRLLVPHFRHIANHFEDTATVLGPQAESETSMESGYDRGPLAETIETQLSHCGSYEIRGVLGSGGMGTVLQAFDPLLKRSVAIKVVNARLLAERDMADRLIREAQAAAAVEHDNIVTVYEVDTHDGSPYIVMPLLRGMTLKQRLEGTEGALPVPEIVRIARETVSGLAAAHTCGLIHCDIKPANLWLEAPQGRVKVLDFGLATVSESDKGDDAGISGTPGYLAPEQVRGEQLDPRTDLFSLGCVLYRMATGRPPFTGDAQMRALWTVLSESPVSAVELNPWLPKELSQLIDCLLRKSPGERPASGAEVLQTLESIERQLKDQQSRATRRRWIAAMFAVAVMSGSVAGGWRMLTAPAAALPVKVTIRGDEPGIPVLLRHEGKDQSLMLGREKTLELLPGDYTVRLENSQTGRLLVPDQFTISKGNPLTLRIALVGEVAHHATHTLGVTDVAVLQGLNAQTVFSVGLDRTLVAWNSAATRPPAFINLPHAARCLAVSSDGHNVVTAGGNKQPPAELAIRVWQTNDLQSAREPLVGHTRMVQSLAWSPDRTRLASAGADGVFLWDVATGASHVLPGTERQSVYALAFSGTDERLVTGSTDGQVVLWDLRSQTPLQTHDAGPATVRAVGFLSDRIVSAGDDGVIRIWNEGALQHEYLNRGKPVLALAVSSDHQLLLTGDNDGEIRVWSVTAGRPLHVLSGHTGAVNSVSFTQQDRQAVSGGADGVVKLWQLPFSD